MVLGATRIFLPVVFDTFPKWCARTEVALIKRMEDCRFIIDIKDFYEGPSESVIVTDFAAGNDLFETIFSTAHRGSALPLAIKVLTADLSRKNCSQ